MTEIEWANLKASELRELASQDALVRKGFEYLDWCGFVLEGFMESLEPCFIQPSPDFTCFKT